MNLSSKGHAMIEGFEGRRNRVYLDSAGLRTGGIGRLLEGTNWSKGDVIPDELIDRWFEEDIEKAEKRVEEILDATDFNEADETQPRLDALISLSFNLGNAPFRYNTGLVRALSKGALVLVPDEIRRWNKARVNGKLKVVPGLKTRREAEARLFAEGLYPAAARPQAPAGRVLRRGDRGPAVKALQTTLAKLGYLHARRMDGIFGPVTEAALQTFQACEGLKVDGIAGPAVFAALKAREGET